MAAYLPPLENVPIFNSELFLDGSDLLDFDTAKKLFLRFPLAQGTQSMLDVNMLGTITFPSSGNTLSAQAWTGSVNSTISSVNATHYLTYVAPNSSGTSPLLKNTKFSLNPVTQSIAIGDYLKVSDTTTKKIAIGADAGLTSQSSNAVAIGGTAGNSNQGTRTVAIGLQAGQTSQSTSAIAIGGTTGQTSQGLRAIAIGDSAGTGTQGESAVAIGYFAGSNSQSINAIGIGTQAGLTSQGIQCIAIGLQAGQTSQGTNSVAIGHIAGQTTQGSSAVSIGASAGNSGQSLEGIAIGSLAGQTNQGESAIAIGASAGNSGQLESGLAIGYQAGQTTQGEKTVAIGYQAGKTTQSDFAVSIGNLAGINTQSSNAIAIGNQAGEITQGVRAIAIGLQAGESSQGTDSIAIGRDAGKTSQLSQSISIGLNAGLDNQKGNAIAIGISAGQITHGTNCIAIGTQAAETSGASSTNTICIGNRAGILGVASNSIIIGNNAGNNNRTGNASGSIILNATGSNLDSANSGSFNVSPIRARAENAGGFPLFYNNNEITQHTSTNILIFQTPITTGGTIRLSPRVSTPLPYVIECDGTAATPVLNIGTSIRLQSNARTTNNQEYLGYYTKINASLNLATFTYGNIIQLTPGFSLAIGTYMVNFYFKATAQIPNGNPNATLDYLNYNLSTATNAFSASPIDEPRVISGIRLRDDNALKDFSYNVSRVLTQTTSSTLYLLFQMNVTGVNGSQFTPSNESYVEIVKVA